jgi:DNA-binding beta-propeller fold protein YncE
MSCRIAVGLLLLFVSSSAVNSMAMSFTTAQTTGTLEILWQSNGGPDSLALPYGMDVDPEGNLWVSDSGNDRFQIIAPDGTFRGTWGASGSSNAEFQFLAAASPFHRPYGDIAFDADGNFYVADTGNARIQKFAPDRAFVRSWGSDGLGEGQFRVPISIAVGQNGVVYVCDEVRNDVQMFDRDGEYLGVFGGTGSDDGEFLVPSGVAVDGNGDVWVADWGNDRMQHYSADGEWLASWGTFGREEGELNGPNDVVIDEQDRLYVADSLNNRLQVFTPDGQVLAAVGGNSGSNPGEFFYALGLALDADGVVYVSDRQRVQAFRTQFPDSDM